MADVESLTVNVLPHGGDLPSGAPLQCTGNARATLESGAERLQLSIALPEAALSEVRWIVDRLVRVLASSLDYTNMVLTLDDRVEVDVGTALALDLVGRARGSLKLDGRPDVRDAFERVRPHEQMFKSWVDEDPAERTSLAIADDVADLSAAYQHVTAEIHTEAELAALEMRLLLAVGGGSKASPARLAIAQYRPPGSDGKAPLMLLGKGVTFDTGGINVKPYESFVSMMKNDMAGAALAFTLFRALVEAEYREPLALVIPTCENAIGSASMRPGAIINSYRGHRVRVDHTDAEGRLILADALAYASDTLEPAQILCFATLTTSALISYGPFATPVHFADGALQTRLEAASAACGEDLHFFPERIWHREANRDKEADLRNTARLPGHASRGAGSRNAAHFLKSFSDRPLCHFDIFASTWNWSGEAPGAGYGATGAPMRTLLRALTA